MTVRQSNIELLRLISMLMILILHFNGHALTTSGTFCTAEGVLWNLVETLTITAVSIFVLISGYFGIHFKIKGVLKLYLRCLIWGLIGYILYCIFNSSPISISKLLARFLPFTHGKWWFMVTYLELYFLSPVLNAAIGTFDKRKHIITILIFGFVTLYMGYCRETGEDTWGTSLSHFLWLYLIARYIRLYVNIEIIRNKRWLWLLGFIISSGVIFGLAALGTKFPLPVCLRAYPYNSPWVLIGAISLLLFALSFDFENKVVNWFASSSLSAYLLQDSVYFGFGVLYPYISCLLLPIPLLQRYVAMICFSILWLLGICVIDKGWDYCFYRPICKLYEHIYETYIPQSFKNIF